jgi:hypothetical protein
MNEAKDPILSLTNVPKNNGFFYFEKKFLKNRKTGVPDFSWYNIPKRGKIHKLTTKYNKES